MSLTAAERALCALFTEACAGDVAGVATALDEASAAGATPSGIDDVLLLVVPYGGVPRALLAFGEWRKRGLAPAAPHFRPHDAEASGLTTFTGVYGARTARVLRELDGYHPDLRTAIVEDAYGRVLARPSLPERLRELAAVPALLAMAAPRQAAAHALGARQYGASVEDVIEAAETAQKRVERARLADALVMLRERMARAE
jgi:alkylhydroperoxidase/carboxymuconolactone decarboxylase family protein YurZ